MKLSKAHISILSVMFVFLIICICLNFFIKRKNKENFIASLVENAKKDIQNNEIMAANAVHDIGAPVLVNIPSKPTINIKCPDACIVRSQTINELAKKGYISNDSKEIILKAIYPTC